MLFAACDFSVAIADGDPESQPAAESNESEAPFAKRSSESEDSATASKKSPPNGTSVRIAVPITSRSERTAKWDIQRAVERLGEIASAGGSRRPTLLLEFVPAENAGAGSQFGPSYDLARFLTSRELANVETVAFLPRSVSGHAVLVVMACEQVIMATDAEIGKAARDEDATKPIEGAIGQAYREISAKRRTFPEAIALGMLDKNFEVLRIETEDGPEIVFRRDLEQLLKRTSERTDSRREVIFERGETDFISGRRARRLGMVKRLAADRREVADALGLPLRAVSVGPESTQDIRSRLITVKGYIDAKTSNTRRRMIDNSVRDGVNYICFWIDADDGDLNAAIELGSAIKLFKPGKVRTVAYVPHEAQGAGAIVALACDEIVMHPDAVLGGGDREFTADEIVVITKFLRGEDAAGDQRRWSLPAAMFDPDLVVDAYRHQRSDRLAHFSLAELQSQPVPGLWRREGTFSPQGETLTVDGERAVELGLAGETAASFEDFKASEQLEGEVSLVEPGWAEDFVEILTTPQIASLLLLIGLVGMYSEVQLPGIGVGGFVATLAFVLFFWANYMEQTANTLEILLFLVGMACLVLEVFVIPGFGIFGLGGGMLVIVSLVLASQTFVLPGTPTEMKQLRDSLLVVGGSGVAFVGLAMLMRRYLPHTPVFRHVLLAPPGGEHPEALSEREAMVDLRHLMGTQGIAMTPLTPAGKARFGDQLVDVVSDGDLIEKGSGITVAEVHGNRVVVKSVDA